MKSLAVLMMVCFAGNAMAADSCGVQSKTKKLAGAAQASFMKKCVTDSCTSQAATKKLAGAAKTSFTRKCMADGMAM